MSLVEAAAPLDAGHLRAAFAGEAIGHHIVVLDATTSTNDVVVEMAADHHEGLVVFAETQTAARGQYGRRWESAARNGLWLSILLRPRITVSDSARLTDLLAWAVATAVEDQAPCRAKPNIIANDGVAGTINKENRRSIV